MRDSGPTSHRVGARVGDHLAYSRLINAGLPYSGYSWRHHGPGAVNPVAADPAFPQRRPFGATEPVTG